MAGRGRGKTLPAWMTSGSSEVSEELLEELKAKAAQAETTTSGSVTNSANSENTDASVSSSTHAQFASVAPAQQLQPTPLSNQIQPTFAAVPNSVPAPVIAQANPLPHFIPGQQFPRSMGFVPPPAAAGAHMMQPPMARGVPFAPGLGGVQGHAPGMSVPGMPGLGMSQGYPPRGAPFYPGAAPGGMAPGMGMGMGMMPRPVGPRGFPMAPVAPVAPAQPTVGDPNNDITCWSEHEATVGADTRKYWFNRVTGLSTYEKPFCLKTPEERSIPPCAWKEYTSPDGRKYYSDGKESSWTVPEAYRVWKEKIDALEKKKLMKQQEAAAAAAAAASATAAEAGGAADAVAGGVGGGGSEGNGSGSSQSFAGVKRKAGAVDSDDEGNGGKRVPVVYATLEEAKDAFKALLADMKIGATTKMKEVTDICQKDPRFNALSTMGEKKQALAEYQTKVLKQEKEAQKAKARKARDAFLILLAESTFIEARSRWRDVYELLEKDVRYKNVEDPVDREELFNDFVSELAKKENEDRRKQRDLAMKRFGDILDSLVVTGVITRKTVFGDVKKTILEKAKDSEFRAIDEADMRRVYKDLTDRLESEYREERRKQREEQQKKIDGLCREFKVLLESLASEGKLTANCRWKDWQSRPEMTDSVVYKALLEETSASDRDNERNRMSEKDRDRDRERGTDGSSSSSSGGGAASSAVARDVFEKIVSNLREDFRSDKRLVRDILDELAHDTCREKGYRGLVSASTTLEEFEDLLQIAVGLKPPKQENGKEDEEMKQSKGDTATGTAAGTGTGTSSEGTSSVPDKPQDSIQQISNEERPVMPIEEGEEGEELEEAPAFRPPTAGGGVSASGISASKAGEDLRAIPFPSFPKGVIRSQKHLSSFSKKLKYTLEKRPTALHLVYSDLIDHLKSSSHK